MTFIVPRLSMTSSHKTTSIDLQCYQNDVEQFYNFLLRRRYSLLPKFYSMELLLLPTKELVLYLLLKSTLWNLYYWGGSTFSCWGLLYGISTTEEVLLSPAEVYSVELLLPSTEEILLSSPSQTSMVKKSLQLTKKIKQKEMVQHFCFSSHSWSVKLDVRSNFIYNPDLYNYVIIYIMKISSTLFLYKEVFLSALDMPRSRPSSPTSRPAPNCQYSPDSLCHCIPYFIF